MSLLARRQAAADRHDAALHRWPDRKGRTFATELQSVVVELTVLTSTGITAWEGNEAEYARTLRYLVDAYFDLAQGRDTALLAHGAQAYRRAEVALGDGDAVEHAKLDFNFGNTLRGLSEGQDASLLRQTKERYLRARNVFQTNLPQLLPSVDVALRIVDAQIALAGQYVLGKSAIAELARIQAFLADTSVPREERSFVGRSMLAAFRLQFASELAQDAVKRALDMLAGDLGEAATNQLAKELDVLRRAAAPSSEPSRGDPMMTIWFDMLMARVEQDVREGRITPVREAAIRAQLAAFRTMMESGAEEIPDLLAVLGESRELAETFADFIKRPSFAGAARPRDAARTSRGPDRRPQCPSEPPTPSQNGVFWPQRKETLGRVTEERTGRRRRRVC